MRGSAPRRLTAAAEQARLGGLEAVDQGPPPWIRAAWTLLGVVVAITFSIVLAWLVRTRGAPDALRFLALLSLFVTFVPFGRALRGLVVGAPTTCVHERGVVLGDKRTARAVPWAELDAVRRLRSGSTLRGWELRRRDGTVLGVALRGSAEERAAAATALERSADRAGVPLTEQD